MNENFANYKTGFSSTSRGSEFERLFIYRRARSPLREVPLKEPNDSPRLSGLNVSKTWLLCIIKCHTHKHTVTQVRATS